MELLTSGVWIAGIVLFQFVVSRDIGGNSSSGSDAQAQSSTHSRSLDPRSFPLRTELHLQRKAQHALTGLLFYIASWALPSHVTVVALFVAAGVFFVAHQLRKLNPRVDAMYVKSFYGILRREEASKAVLPGAFYFLLGTAITVAIYPVSVARISILCLGVGDPAASLMGTLYNQHNKKNVIKTKKNKQKSQSTKSWAGFAGALVASFAATFLAMSWSDTQKAPIEDKQVMVRLAKALFAGVAAAIAEMISIAGHFDHRAQLALLNIALLVADARLADPQDVVVPAHGEQRVAQKVRLEEAREDLACAQRVHIHGHEDEHAAATALDTVVLDLPVRGVELFARPQHLGSCLAAVIRSQ